MSRDVVVFYVSGHGFGHASRQIEVVHALRACSPDLHPVLRTSVSPSLLARSLRVPHTVLAGPCDTGVIQRDSVTHDDDATVREAWAFHATLESRVAAEVARLAPFRVRGIVGDIPPLAFEVAARLRVPSIAIANFTWDWIYEWYPGQLAQAPGLIARVRRAYGAATLALRLPLSDADGFTVFPRVERLPLIARRANLTRTETRNRLGLTPSQKVALLSFGGYGLQRLDVAALDCLREWTILLTDRIVSTPHRAPSTGPRGGAAAPPDVIYLPESTFEGDLRYEDLVAAADVVVTKPGYGIISECAAAGTAVLYTSRGHFREYDLLVAEMPSLVRCRFLSQEDLFGGRWREVLEALLAAPAPSAPPDLRGATLAAQWIAETCGVTRVTSGR